MVSKKSMINILITGGAGNIGSAFTNALARDENTNIIIVDNLLTGDINKVPLNLPNVKLIKADVNEFIDISSVFYSIRFDYVFHFAAVVGVKRTLDNPLWVLKDIKGIENILLLCKNTGVKRLYYSSSSEVYGEPVELPQNEYTTPLNSRLPYAIVKNIGEAFIRSYQKEFGLDYVIFRFFNTYGPNQSEDFVIPRFIKKALRGEDITIYGNGNQTRTFCYVDDNVSACLRAHKECIYVNDVLNIGSDVEVTIKSLAEMIVRMTQSSSKIVYLPPLKEGDMSRRKPDVSKMKVLLKRPPVSLEEGIKNLIDIFKK